MESGILIIGKILGVDREALATFDRAMAAHTGKRGVLERVAEELAVSTDRALRELKLTRQSSADDVRRALRERLAGHEAEFSKRLRAEPGADQFQKAAHLAHRITKPGRGWFLKKKFAEEILRKSNPKNLLAYRGYRTTDELLKREDVFAAFSALRFVESDAWMHETFATFYSKFAPADFEERDIAVKVLGPEWEDVARKFVAKKHHNVSHLKEFGVIFINPIREDVPGKLLRDFTLLLHYFHEIEFYARLFRAAARAEDFAERIKSLLRGDVLDVRSVKPGEWLIVQRYLAKVDPKDPRLLLPRVNPESLHWGRGERDLTEFAKVNALGLASWAGLDWVAARFGNPGELVSFDLVDNEMSLVAHAEGTGEVFTYHQTEALWTKLFTEYAGGETAAEKLLLDHFEKGVIRF